MSTQLKYPYNRRLTPIDKFKETYREAKNDRDEKSSECSIYPILSFRFSTPSTPNPHPRTPPPLSKTKTHPLPEALPKGVSYLQPTAPMPKIENLADLLGVGS